MHRGHLVRAQHKMGRHATEQLAALPAAMPSLTCHDPIPAQATWACKLIEVTDAHMQRSATPPRDLLPIRMPMHPYMPHAPLVRPAMHRMPPSLHAPHPHGCMAWLRTFTANSNSQHEGRPGIPRIPHAPMCTFGAPPPPSPPHGVPGGGGRAAPLAPVQQSQYTLACNDSEFPPLMSVQISWCCYVLCFSRRGAALQTPQSASSC